MSVQRTQGARGNVAMTPADARKALDNVLKQADAHVAKLDVNKDGKITEPEMKKFMKTLEKATQKMEKDMSKLTEAGDMNSPEFKKKFAKQLETARGAMTDKQRMDIAVANAMVTLADDHGGDSVPLADVKAGVRKQINFWVETLKAPQDGLEGALGAMFALMFIPDELFKSVRR